MRLRPTTTQLKAWNSGRKKETSLKTHREYDWTGWLRELAPLAVIDEIGSSDTEKSERRKRVLQHMYDLATLEEQYKDEAIGRLAAATLADDVALLTLPQTATPWCSHSTTN